MKLDKSLRREKKRRKKKHGMVVTGRSNFVINWRKSHGKRRKGKESKNGA